MLHLQRGIVAGSHGHIQKDIDDGNGRESDLQLKINQYRPRRRGNRQAWPAAQALPCSVYSSCKCHGQYMRTCRTTSAELPYASVI